MDKIYCTGPDSLIAAVNKGKIVTITNKQYHEWFKEFERQLQGDFFIECTVETYPIFTIGKASLFFDEEEEEEDNEI